MDLFYVLKDEEGILRPLAFIAPVSKAGEYMVEDFKNKTKAWKKAFETGTHAIVKCELKEIV